MKIEKGNKVKVVGPPGSFFLDDEGVAEQTPDQTGWLKVFFHREWQDSRPSEIRCLHQDNLERVT